MAGFGTFVTVIAALAIPPSYTATAQIVIDPGPRAANSTHSTIFETVDPTVIDTAIAILTSEDHFRSVRASLYDYSGFQSETPKETSVLRASIEELRAWLRAFVGSIKSIFPMPDDPEAEAGEARPGIPSVGELRAGLTVNQERRSRIISVSYTDKSPDRAAVIANQFVDLHIEGLRDRNRREAERLVAWLDQRIVEVKAEAQEAEERVQSFRIAHGTNSVEADAELIAQTRRQLARARSEIAAREAAIDTPRSAEVIMEGRAEVRDVLAPELGATGDSESELLQARLNNEAEVIRSQASMLEQYLKSLQSGAADRLDSEAELRFLDRQAASAAEHYNDLLRRKQEIAEEQDNSTVAAHILATARAPARPSSINPILFIPAGLIAFSAFGGAIAAFLERMDRTLRSERDIVDVLGVSCIGLVPNIPPIYRHRRIAHLFNGISSAYGQAIDSIAAATLQPAGPSVEPMVILVTSSVPGEGKTTLATSLAACAARLGRRVLLVDRDLKDPSSSAAFEMVADENACHPLPQRHIGVGPIGRIPVLECDYLPVRRTGADQPSLVAAQKVVEICQRLRESYDCVIIDGPPAFATEARLLSTVADKVIFAVRWGSTRREVAGNALQQLRHSNRFESLANVHAVLTRVHLRKHARYRLGDMGEFLQKHRRHYSSSGLWNLTRTHGPTGQS
jgi:uncharacterized protein involved in exopolysaccharide biosynthesis/cellulose biosynthesis protein BcsQ